MEPETDLEDDLRPEYGAEVFENGVRGKYYARFMEGAKLVRLDPDVSAVFTNAEQVNSVLRALIATMPPVKPAA